MPLAAIGAIAGSVVQGVMGNKAANAQAKATTEASAAAVAEQRRQYDQNRADLQPWMQQGGGAVNQLGYLLGIAPQKIAAPTNVLASRPIPQRNSLALRRNDPDFGFGGGFRPMFDEVPAAPQAAPPDPNSDPNFGSLMRDFSSADFEKDPGYDFRLAEGQKALERSAAARGNALGGSAVKASQRFGQDYASNEFLNAYNRFQSNRATKYNQLAGLAGLGQQSANTLANAGANSANNISGILVNQGNRLGDARASGYASTANAINGGLNNLLSLYGGG